MACQKKGRISMEDPRGFVSFDIDHNEDEKKLFIGQAKNKRTPFNFEG